MKKSMKIKLAMLGLAMALGCGSAVAKSLFVTTGSYNGNQISGLNPQTICANDPNNPSTDHSATWAFLLAGQGAAQIGQTYTVYGPNKTSLGNVQATSSNLLRNSTQLSSVPAINSLLQQVGGFWYGGDNASLTCGGWQNNYGTGAQIQYGQGPWSDVATEQCSSGDSVPLLCIEQ